MFLRTGKHFVEILTYIDLRILTFEILHLMYVLTIIFYCSSNNTDTFRLTLYLSCEWNMEYC